MPTSCVVVGCKSRASRGGDRKFYSFPLLRKQSAQQMAITQTRQTAWLKALNRSNFFPSQYKNARVCDLHFISGKSACYSDVDDPDWVPSLNLGSVIDEDEQHSASSPIFNSAVDVSANEDVGNVSTKASEETQTSVATSSTGTQTFVPTSSTGTQTFVPTSSTGTQTDGTITSMSDELIFSYK